MGKLRLLGRSGSCWPDFAIFPLSFAWLCFSLVYLLDLPLFTIDPWLIIQWYFQSYVGYVLISEIQILFNLLHMAFEFGSIILKEIIRFIHKTAILRRILRPPPGRCSEGGESACGPCPWATWSLKGG